MKGFPNLKAANEQPGVYKKQIKETLHSGTSTF